MDEKRFYILRYRIRIPLLHIEVVILLAVAFRLDEKCEPARHPWMCGEAKERRKTMQAKASVRSVSFMGILVAMEIILARFSVHTWNLKIGFSFIPIVVAAILYGPIQGGLVAAVGDVISAILFPVGAFFPGFTLTAFLTGAVFGWFFRKKVTVCNTILAVLVVQGIIGQVMNTYWISFLYGSPFGPLFLTRIGQAAAMGIVQVVCILLIAEKLIPVLKKFNNA